MSESCNTHDFDKSGVCSVCGINFRQVIHSQHNRIIELESEKRARWTTALEGCDITAVEELSAKFKQAQDKINRAIDALARPHEGGVKEAKAILKGQKL